MLSRRAITGGIASLLAAKPVIARRKHPQIGGGGGDGGGGGYVAKAVHFNGTQTLGSSLLSIADSPLGITSFWTKGTWSSSLNNDYLIATLATGYAFFPGSINFINGPEALNASFDLPTDDVWHSGLISWNTNLSANNKLLALYIDDMLISLRITDPEGPFSVPYNGQIAWFCASNQDSPSTVGDFADFVTYTQRSIVQSDGTILIADRRNFISAGGKRPDQCHHKPE